MQQLDEYGSSESSCNEGLMHIEIDTELPKPKITTEWQIDTLSKFVSLKRRYDTSDQEAATIVSKRRHPGQFREACGRRMTRTKHSS